MVSGCSAVFVNRAAEDAVAADRGVARDDGGGVVIGWAMFPTLMWAMIVVMPGERVKHRDGVAFVVDQHPVGAFRSHAADESFGVTVCLGRSWRSLHDVDAL